VAVFSRQQELVLNADKIDKREIQHEEQKLKNVLDMMLDVKAKKLAVVDSVRSLPISYVALIHVAVPGVVRAATTKPSLARAKAVS